MPIMDDLKPTGIDIITASSESCLVIARYLLRNTFDLLCSLNLADPVQADLCGIRGDLCQYCGGCSQDRFWAAVDVVIDIDLSREASVHQRQIRPQAILVQRIVRDPLGVADRLKGCGTNHPGANFA